MSVIVGLLKETEAQVTEQEIHHLLAPTERYATGAGTVYLRNDLGWVFSNMLRMSARLSTIGLSPIPAAMR